MNASKESLLVSDLFEALKPRDADFGLSIWFENFFHWLGRRYMGSEAPLRFLIQLIAKNPEWQKSFGTALKKVLEEGSSRKLLAHLSKCQEASFFSELSSRMQRKILPAPRSLDHRDLLKLFVKATQRYDVSVLLEPALIQNLWQQCQFDDRFVQECRNRFADDLRQASLLICARLFVDSTHSSLSSLFPPVHPQQSPFFKVQSFFTEEFSVEKSLDVLLECRSLVESAQALLKTQGVSVGAVYRLEAMAQSVDRLTLYHHYLNRGPQAWTAADLMLLIKVLVRDMEAEDGVFSLLGSNVHLLSRKIVEHTGDVGEHYIAKHRSEYFSLIWSSLKGGALTAGTVVVKLLMSTVPASPLGHGVLYSLNYASSFLVIQFTGSSLATKISSLTASSLAATIEEKRRDGSSQNFFDQVLRLLQSQVAAVVGNVVSVVPVCLLINIIYYLTSGSYIMGQEKAIDELQSFDLFGSLTFLYACLTGVLLWVASMLGGWVSNFIHLHDLRSRLLFRRLPLGLSAKHVDLFPAIATNVFLGFLLGLTPILGKFTGLPFDVRHVTLSAGNLILAISSLPWNFVFPSYVFLAFVSIVLIGVANITVSFGLSLIVALQAREVPLRELREMLPSAFRFIKQNYWRILLPPKGGKGS